MNSESQAMLLQQPAVKSILKGIVLWAPLWIGSTALFGAIGFGYAYFVKKDVYLASQAATVRDEAKGTLMRLGRFESATQMKAAQETILEMSKNHQVIREALAEVGPTSSSWSLFGSVASAGSFPTDRDVETFAKSGVLVHPPKGVEFGATEVIYVDVKAETPSLALKLSKVFCRVLDARLREVREQRALSIISELEAARTVARQELERITANMKEMEVAIGAELPDLRNLTEPAGAGVPRSQIDLIMTELRLAQSQYEQLTADQRLLEEALADPASYVIAPGTLLNAQPGLKKLREGLADAQIATSALRGRFTDAHPLVVAAFDAQFTIEQRLINSLEASRVTLMQDIDTCKRRIDALNEQKKKAEKRLDGLASVRTQYANLVSELKTRTTIVEDTEKAISEARASRESALNVSLLTLLDEPVVGDKPVGPGKTVMVGLFAASGMLLGLGFVFAITPIDGFTRFGRRSSDRMAPGQRLADASGNDSAQPYSTVERRNDKLAEIVRNARQPRQAVDVQHANGTAAGHQSNAGAKADFEKFLAPAEAYEMSNDGTSHGSDVPVDNSNLTILERLAMVQEACQEPVKPTEGATGNTAAVALGVAPNGMPERRSNRREPQRQAPQLDAVYRRKAD